ncbi:MAG TPA: hypothetical protein VF098_06115 [Sphingomicrobium sp.]|jgi:hypothetical protein
MTTAAMNIMPRFLCRFIGHHRSRRRAYIDREERRWRSYCRRCGAPMRKHGLTGWEEA